MSRQKYLSCLDVQAEYNITRSTIYRWIKEGLFPRPVKLGPRMARWRSADLLKWEEERGAA